MKGKEAVIAMNDDLPSMDELNETQRELNEVVDKMTGINAKDRARICRYIRDHFRLFRALRNARDYARRVIHWKRRSNR